MSNWISGNDLIAHWQIEDFELFDFLKKGLQPYSRLGKKIVDSDPLERGPLQSIEEIENNLRKGKISGYGMLAYTGGIPQPVTTKKQIKLAAQWIYGSQGSKILNPPGNCILMSFTLPKNANEAYVAIEETKWFLFKKDEASEFAEKHGYPKLETSPEVLLENAGSQSYEDVIKPLTLQYENDESIIIKSESGKKETFRYDDRDLGFKNNRTKEWTFFLRVLKCKQPIKVNEHERKWMRKVEEKLKNLIGNLNHIDIPRDYKLFYHDKSDEPGCYRTRFNTIVKSQNTTFIDEDDFNERLTEVVNLIRTKRVEASTESAFFRYLEYGKQHGYLTADRRQQLLRVYEGASVRHGEIEHIPRGDAIENDPDLS